MLSNNVIFMYSSKYLLKIKSFPQLSGYLLIKSRMRNLFTSKKNIPQTFINLLFFLI